MKFLREDHRAAERAIAEAICNGLFADERVLWLVSGGSNIAVEKAVMDSVRNHASEKLGGLAVLPMDERYGPMGHKDSNAMQLREAGFDIGKGTLIDVLVHDLPFDQTISFYNDLTSTVLSNASVIIGEFGMGSDGHVAGIKPDSPAAIVDESTVAGYEWSDYIRMTLTPAALRNVTAGFLIAYGGDKNKPLTQLRKNKLSLAKLPALLLYELPNVIVYNDQIESEG